MSSSPVKPMIPRSIETYLTRGESEPHPAVLTKSRAVIWLSMLVAIVAFAAAGIGLFWPGGNDPATFTTLRGETVEIYGQGLYRYDTIFVGSGNKGTDAVTLFVGIPLLMLSSVLYWRGSLRGGLVLIGALTWFLYVYTSYALGAVTYNNLFLAYVALFSASLFALVVMFRSVDVRQLTSDFSPHMPRRGPASFLFVSGALTLAVWLMSPVAALIQGGPPDGLDSYTTLFTNALDSAIIVPLAFIAGMLILKRDALGYVIAIPLLILEAFLAPMIGAQTVSQLSAGVQFTTGEIVGPVSAFSVVALLAVYVSIVLLRNISDSA